MKHEKKGESTTCVEHNTSDAQKKAPDTSTPSPTTNNGKPRRVLIAYKERPRTKRKRQQSNMTKMPSSKHYNQSQKMQLNKSKRKT